jgi:hypothetical protein
VAADHAWRSCRIATCLAALCVSAQVASAQDSVRDVLSFLVTNQAVVTDDFVRDRDAAEATRDTIFRFLQVEIGALPISSSSGGFIYRFNPALGTVERASDSFGAFFVERALTSGRGQTSLGVTYRQSRFNRLDDRSLEDGTFVTTANRLAGEAAPFDVETLTLRLEASTFTIFGSYGVTDRLEVGAAVPIVDLALSGERQNVYRGAVFQQATGTAFATGLADIALRAKYSLVQTRTVGVAADVDLRLPTGSEEQLLGAGRPSVRAAGIASFEGHRFGTHVTAGLRRGGVSDEVTFGTALVFAVAPRFNVVGEIFGRRLDTRARIAAATAPHPQLPNVATTRLLADRTGTTTAQGLAGVKWNIARTWLLNANVLVPLTNTGLTGRLTPSIALDYTFDRR